MSTKPTAKVIDLATRRAAKKPRRVRCLIQPNCGEPEFPIKGKRTTLRMATPEEYEANQHWSVAPVIRATPKKDSRE